MRTEFVKGPVTKEDNLRWLSQFLFRHELQRQKELFPYLRADLKKWLITKHDFKP